MPRPRQKDGRVHGVVVACQREDGRWLCIRRSKTVAAPLKVCFPGGAVEIGESQESAVVREMREELGVELVPVKCVWRWDSPTGELTLWGWIAEWRAALSHGAPGEYRERGPDIRPDPAEVAEVLWLTAGEVSTHPDAMPTNPSFVKALLAACV